MKLKTAMKAAALFIVLSAATVLGMSANADAALSNFKEIECSTSTISLSWESLGADVNSYLVEVSRDKSFPANATTQKSVPWSHTIISDLASGTSFYLRVSSCSDYSSKTILETSETYIIATAPDRVTNITQSSAGSTSADITWDAVSGATSYEVAIYNNGNYSTVTTATTNSCTLPNLAAGSSYSVCVRALHYASPNLTTTSSYSSSLGCTVKTTPTAILNFGLSSTSPSFTWTMPANATATQIVVADYKGKVIRTINDKYSYASTSVAKGKFYKARARSYVTIGTQNFYGPWTPYKYFAKYKSLAVTSKGKKLYAKWGKVAGAKYYDVSISKTYNAGYKKVKRVSAKKTSLTIKKFGKKSLKKGTTYYVRLSPVIRVGKSNVVSPMGVYTSRYISRY